MSSPFRKIAAAIAFSPRITAVLAEAVRMKAVCDAELILIHVGKHTNDEEQRLAEHLATVGIVNPVDIKVFWEEGNPSDRILSTCKKEKVDLLIAGALKKENIVQYYLGTVARKILRRADCSVLVLTNPLVNPSPFHNIVVNAEDSPYVEDAIAVGCYIGTKEKATWLHVVRELKMYGLTMAAAGQYSEKEYEQLRHNLVRDEIEVVQQIIDRIPHPGLKVNIKLVAGKSGFELAKFTERKHADLLVVGATRRKFSLFDRVFAHDLEYIFANLPCNLLIVHANKPRKEAPHG